MEAAASRDSTRCALQLLGKLSQNSASATRRRKEVTCREVVSNPKLYVRPGAPYH